MDFVDPATGNVRMAAADGGQMNYVRMRPGVGVVADVDGSGTILQPQERYVTNLAYGSPQLHYETPAGGVDEKDISPNGEIDETALIKTAEREFGEEAGYTADDFIVLGSRHGLMTHSGMSTHHHATVLARGVKPNAHGPLHEATEILGKKEIVSWDDADEMYLNPNGLMLPDGTVKRISSIGTVASLGMAQKWLARNAELGPKHIDLKSKHQ